MQTVEMKTDLINAAMKFAYTDPPYFGHSAKFYSEMHPNAADYDKIETHAALITRMCSEFDGWALSREARVMPWVKPFASFKPGVGVAYAWEPVIVWGGRKRRREQHTVRDWHSENITLRRGFTGAKPDGLILWIIDVLNAERDDEIHDLFPGSGAVARAIQVWHDSPPLPAFETKDESGMLL